MVELLGPGYKNLESALRAYMRAHRAGATLALVLNRRTGKWHTVHL